MNNFFSASQNRIIQLIDLLIKNGGIYPLNLAYKQIVCKKETLIRDINNFEKLNIEKEYIHLNTSTPFHPSIYKAMCIKESVEFQIIMEIYEGKFTSIEDFSRNNYISISTTQRKVKNLKAIASAYNLTLKLNQIDKFIGSEFDIRVFYSEVFSFIYTYFESSFEKEQLVSVKKCVRELFFLLEQKQNNENQIKVSYFYLVSIHRVRQGRYLEDNFLNLFEEIYEFLVNELNEETPLIKKLKSTIEKLLLKNIDSINIKEDESMMLVLTLLFFKNYQNLTSLTHNLYSKLFCMKTEKVLSTMKLVKLISEEFQLNLNESEKKILFLNIFFIFVQKNKWNRLNSRELDNSKLSEFRIYDLYMYEKIQAINYAISEDVDIQKYEFSDYFDILRLNALILEIIDSPYQMADRKVIVFYNSQLGANHEKVIQRKIENIFSVVIVWTSKLTEHVNIILTDKLVTELLEFGKN